MKKILFVVPLYKNRSPSQRFRIEQFTDFFQENGFICETSNLITPETDRLFYSKGNILQKLFLFFKFGLIRIKDVLRASKYDIVFVQREAFFVGPAIFEKLFSRKTKLVFDFDDAIWLPNISKANKKLEWLKNYKKTSKIIAYADSVIAGNEYLKQYALQYNKTVVVIPTTVDTNKYKKLKSTDTTDTVVIGWSGSVTTVQHFEYAIGFLKKLKEKYGRKIEIKLIGDGAYQNEVLGIKGIAWNNETEIQDLSEFDIGIMPLPDDEWTNGKCGLKGLLYMALEIPAVMSPVGVNTEIIQDGENGFLAAQEEEWVEKLSRLIDDKDLRIRLGKAGRKTVVEKYSVEANKKKYLTVFNEVLSK